MSLILSDSEPYVNIPTDPIYLCLYFLRFSLHQPYVNIPTDPTGVPQNFIAVAASSTSITLRWEALLADLQNGIIRSYHISVVELETGRVQLFTTNNTDRVLIVNLLHPFYTYNCTIAAYTIGLGPSISVSVQTLPEGTYVWHRVIA